jgi:hypothetical protein
LTNETWDRRTRLAVDGQVCPQYPTDVILTRTEVGLGGNGKKVSANGFTDDNLHHYWDSEFVNLLETNVKSIASDLIGHISKEQERKWQSGSPADCAVETFQVAKADAYGRLPEPSGRNTYQLIDEYVTNATDDVAQQLSKAGVRLAFALNNALHKQ